MNSKNKILILLVAVIIVVAGAFYFLRGKEKIDYGLQVENKAGVTYQVAGIQAKGSIVVQKSNSKEIFFPKELTNSFDKVQLLFIQEDGKKILSDAFSIKENPKVIVEKVEGQKAILNVKTDPLNSEEINLPSLNEWKIKTDDKMVIASYKGDTDLSYQIYVLGEGGKLGSSDKVTKNAEAICSWEKRGDALDSWIHFTK